MFLDKMLLSDLAEWRRVIIVPIGRDILSCNAYIGPDRSFTILRHPNSYVDHQDINCARPYRAFSMPSGFYIGQLDVI